MKNKFKYLDHIDSIKRFRGIKDTRLNKIRLDANERVSDFNIKFVNSLKRKINSKYLSAYPEIEQIYDLLKKNYGFKSSNYFVTAGSDSGIRHCFELFAKKKGEIICLSPTFGMYEIYSKIFQSNVKKITYNNNLKLDYKKLIQSINKKTLFIIFANPNSPTGTIIEKKEVLTIIKKAKKCNCYVIIDEAYYGFYKETFAKYIHKFSNLIILRTFSKAYGLAGIRAGYIISNKYLIERFYKLRPMYEINSLAVLIIKEILQNKNEYNKYLKETKDGKNFLIKELKKINLLFYKTYANFILVNFKDRYTQEKIYNYLFKKKILTRYPPSIVACKNYLRFTLGPKKYMKILVAHIRKVLKK